MYFDKLMHMTTDARLNINTYTMHQCVTSSATPKKTMHMLADNLDGEATPTHPDAIEARVHFSKMSPWGACTPS